MSNKGISKSEIGRNSGIEIIGNVLWGTHFCLFYQTKADLLDILIPYFKAGLEHNEFCMWITSEPITAEEAAGTLKSVVHYFNEYREKGQIEIVDYNEWYTKSGEFDAGAVLQAWIEKEHHAVESGFDGIRVSGNTVWLEERYWKDFCDYEATINRIIGNHQMIALCAYSLETCEASEILDVITNHQFALNKWAGTWEIIEGAKRKWMEEELKT